MRLSRALRGVAFYLGSVEVGRIGGANRRTGGQHAFREFRRYNVHGKCLLGPSIAGRGGEEIYMGRDGDPRSRCVVREPLEGGGGRGAG